MDRVPLDGEKNLLVSLFHINQLDRSRGVTCVRIISRQTAAGTLSKCDSLEARNIDETDFIGLSRPVHIWHTARALRQ